jgi:glycogen operon protein
VLSRDSNGHVLANPPLLWDIESDPALAGTKVVAEAWDAAGLYQVGSFVGDSWKEWNGRFRDDVRSFFRGDKGTVWNFADRVLGSHEIYSSQGREAEQSVNFVSCHDGFTLNDLVSYNQKHNEVNGDGNRDGADDNRSWNHGVEGPTDDPAIETLRNRQVKNFFTTTLLSLGVPMILMGDEVRHTQHGNNNAYCHDNEGVWFDWARVEKYRDVHRFVRLLIARRLLRDVAPERQRLSLSQVIKAGFEGWHGVKLHQPDWGHDSHSIAFSARLTNPDRHLVHFIFNAYWEALDFELPPLDDAVKNPWHRWIDTYLDSPEDIVDWKDSIPFAASTYRVGPRSVVLLWAALG